MKGWLYGPIIIGLFPQPFSLEGAAGCVPSFWGYGQVMFLRPAGQMKEAELRLLPLQMLFLDVFSQSSLQLSQNLLGFPILSFAATTPLKGEFETVQTMTKLLFL